MDNEFIKIDDLLRQRLGGVEERERNGSWMNMRELLDKEMPQEKPASILYWRRTFGVVAALSLLTTVGIGGYEFSNSLSNRYADNNAPLTDGMTMRPGANSSSSETSVYQLQASPDANNMSAATNTSNVKTNNIKSDNADVNIDRNDNTILLENNTHSSHNENSKSNNSKVVTNQQAASNKTVSNLSSEDRKANANSHTIEQVSIGNVNTTEHSGGRQPLSADRDDIAVTERRSNTGITNQENVTNSIATNIDKNRVGKPTINSGAPVSNSMLSALNNKADNSGTSVAEDNINDVKNTTNKINVNIVAVKIALNQPQPSAKANINQYSNVAINNQKAIIPAKLVTTPMDKAELKNVAVMNISKGKKVIERMIVHERFVKTATNEGYFKLDTISIETLTTDLGLKSENGSHTHNYSKKPGTANYTNAQSNPDENNEVTATDKKIVPAATINTSGTNLKQAPAATKKSAGSTTIQKLNAVFNDIKYNFGAPKFQAGLTAGINGTFFGPNSFKGFQFGITGNLVFNDQWSILSELKYFHRANSNASLQDDYSIYTPTTGGQYTRLQQQNSFSFSALHSLEMPVSIRYAVGNFNIFAGGNLVYNFSINTGAETIPGGNTSIVSAPGNDNAPKLKEEDFTNRVGLGYLLGLSYNVGPGTMIDVRTVQTFWDNANTTGGQTISNQLYKNPSLQLSIIYRLGNRNK